MGLLKAAISTATGVIADQYKEYFYCEAIPENVIALKGKKKSTGRGSNHGADNIISNGSVIAIADGQCMIIVEQGLVVDICSEPGEYVYDMSSEPSIFTGNLKENVKEIFSTVCKRFTFGGETGKDQRVYFFNTKEIPGNKYGTPSPVPFRVVDRNIGLDMDISLRCFGEYSYKVTNPLLFYKNVCGNVSEAYTKDKLEGIMRTELLTALQPAFAKIGDMGVRYSSIPGHTMELAQALNDVLSAKWCDLRGIEIVSFGVSSIKANEEDEATIKELQRAAALSNPNIGIGYTVGAAGQAMQNAAKNPGGAAVGFMGVNMAQNSGYNVAQMYQSMPQQPAAQPAPQADSWTCPSCGANVTGKFCPECGTKKPEPVQVNTWTCSCGAVNKGKFCSECGEKKPAGIPQYKCDKCGWEPSDPAHPPKFCPECGDPFDDGDII